MLIDSFNCGRNDRIHVEIYLTEQGRYEVKSCHDEEFIQIRSFFTLEAAYSFCAGRGWIRGMGRYREHMTKDPDSFLPGSGRRETPEKNRDRLVPRETPGHIIEQ